MRQERPTPPATLEAKLFTLEREADAGDAEAADAPHREFLGARRVGADARIGARGRPTELRRRRVVLSAHEELHAHRIPVVADKPGEPASDAAALTATRGELERRRVLARLLHRVLHATGKDGHEEPEPAVEAFAQMRLLLDLASLDLRRELWRDRTGERLLLLELELLLEGVITLAPNAQRWFRS